MIFVSENSYAPDLTQPVHAHEFTSISMILTGSLRERVGRADVIAGPLSLVVKPLHTGHANVFGPTGVRMLQIVLDSAASRELGEHQRRLSEWRWVHGGAATAGFLRLLRLLRLDIASDVRDTAAIDAIAAIDPPRPGGSAAPPWIHRVCERLDDERPPASVRTLAADPSVHPVYLARCFKAYVGCSITEYLRRRRIQRAADHMRLPCKALSEVAYDAGFFDQAHLCRTFRRATGMPPSEFRALVASS